MRQRSFRTSQWLLTGTVIHATLRPLFALFAPSVEDDLSGLVFRLTRGSLELIYYASCLCGALLLLEELKRLRSAQSASAASDSLLSMLGSALLMVQLPLLLFPGNTVIVAISVTLCGALALVVLSRGAADTTDRRHWCCTLCWGASFASAMQVAWCHMLGGAFHLAGFETVIQPMRLVGQWAWLGMVISQLLIRMAQSAQLRQWLRPISIAALGMIGVSILLAAPERVFLWVLIRNLGMDGQSDRFLIVAVTVSLLIAASFSETDEQKRTLGCSLAMTCIAGWGWVQSWQQLISALALIRIHQSRRQTVVELNQPPLATAAQDDPSRSNPVERIVWMTTLAYIGFFALLSSLSIAAFRTSVDFAGAEQGTWQLAFWQDQFNTVFGAHNFVNHVYGFNLLVAPIFRLLPSPHLLKWLQVAGVACGAPIVFRVAFTRTKSEVLSASLSVVYLLSPVIMNLCIGDYYSLFPVATLLLLVIQQLHRSVWRLAVFAMLALACQENVAPTVFALGLFVALRKDRRTGVCLMTLATLWFGFVALFLIPTLNEGHSTPHLVVYSIYGSTPSEILRTILTRPGFLLYQMLIHHHGLAFLYKSNGIVGFLSLLAPEVLFIDLFDFMANLMTTYSGPHTFGRHYGLLGLPVLFMAAVEGIARAQHVAQRWQSRRQGTANLAAANRAIAVLLISFAVPTCIALGPLDTLRPFALARAAWSEEAAAQRRACRSIPPNAGVAATSGLLLHLAHRPVAYALPNPFQRSGWDGRPSDPDYGKYIVGGETEYHLDRGQDVEFILIAPPFVGTTGLLPDLVRTHRYRIIEHNSYVKVLQRID